MHSELKAYIYKNKTMTTQKKVGAKPKSEADKKFPVTVYITGRQIKKLGGIDKARAKSLEALS